jgi:hypothetical protein
MQYVLYMSVCIFAVPGFCVGAVAPVWGCLLAAECFSVASLGFFCVIGGSLLQDELSLSGFLGFLTTWDHAVTFAVMGAPVLAGHLVRRRVLGPRKARPGGDSN